MDYKYEEMAEMMLTGIRVAKPIGLEINFVAMMLKKVLKRTISLEEFEDYVREVALDLEMIEDDAE